MPQKRKISSTPGRTKEPKKRRQEQNLINLPVEVLDSILLYILPNPEEVQWAQNGNDTVKLFTSPILQTCSKVRQMCLDLINHRVLWIVLKVENRYAMGTFRRNGAELPLLPPVLTNHIKENAAKVRLTFGSMNIASQRSTRSFNDDLNTFILPYNFDSILRVSGLYNLLAKNSHGDSLSISCHNIVGHNERKIHNLVLPALSTFRGFESAEFKIEESALELHSHLPHICQQRWNLKVLLDKAEDTYRRGETLRNSGNAGEAGLLYLASHWLVRTAETYLPAPWDWSRGEVDIEDMQEILDPRPYPGRCPQGNILRRLLHRIEYRACLTWVDFSFQYGRKWRENHEWVYGDSEWRFLDEPHFTWFGLTPAEMAEFHYGRARAQAEIGRSISCHYASLQSETGQDSTKKGKGRTKKAPLHPHERTYLECAQVDMHMARMICFENDEIANIYDQYKQRLGREGKLNELVAKDQFTIIDDPTDLDPDLLNRRIIWAGSKDVLEDWGGQQVLQYLPLAQKGLEVSQTWVEWGIRNMDFGALWPSDENVPLEATFGF